MGATNVAVVSLCLLTLLCLLPFPVHSLRLPYILSNELVLQRAPAHSRIWGSAQPGTVVQVTLDNQPPIKTFADLITGEWVVSLPPQTGSTTEHTIQVAGDGQTITLKQVLFGDVLVCSGQSNMGLTVAAAYNASAEIADSIHYPYLKVAPIPLNFSYFPMNDTLFTDWSVSSPQSIPNFSAVCYFTGRQLYKQLNAQIPIGLIASQFGGTRIEAWASPSANAICGPIDPANGRGHEYNNGSVLFNAMIYPLLHTQLTAVIWFQGEENAVNATNYLCRFPVLIQDWRTNFQQSNLPFHFALLGPITDDHAGFFPWIRTAQLAALILPFTAVANTVDLGDVNSPTGSIHFRDKQPVGQRFMLTLWKHVYGHTDIVAEGPQPYDVIWPDRDTQIVTIIVRYDLSLANNAGLHLSDTENCTLCCEALEGSAFKVRLRDQRVFNSTIAVIAEAGVITVTINVGSPIVAVSSLELEEQAFPQCALKNAANLPALPFFANRTQTTTVDIRAQRNM